MKNKEVTINLREITEDTVEEVCRLNVEEYQKKFVASNAYSIAQAYFSKIAWFRAIYANENIIGFVMIEDQPDKSEYCLWRFMIDKKYQRKGFGLKAMQLIIEHIKNRPNSTEFLTCVVQDKGGPQGFYEKLGFKLTGEYYEGEAIMRLKF